MKNAEAECYLPYSFPPPMARWEISVARVSSPSLDAMRIASNPWGKRMLKFA